MVSTFADLPPENDPIHLMMIGSTKAGKSTYAAAAARDGFRLIYIDADNGASALRNALKGNEEAMKRIHYIRTSNPVELLIAMLRSNSVNPMLWNTDLDIKHSMMNKGNQPEQRVIAFNIAAVPEQVVFVIDSWTALAAAAMGLGADAKSVDILELSESGQMQGVYGDANNRLMFIANSLQKTRFHSIVIAHGTYYERYEKATGMTAREAAKQANLKLIENLAIPVSSSRPNAVQLASRFNYIGWVEVNRMGESELDFTRSNDRVGGGPPNRKAKIAELSFANLIKETGGKVVDPGHSDSWLSEFTVGALVEAEAKAKAERAAATPSKPAAQTQAAKPAVPAKGPLGGLNLKK